MVAATGGKVLAAGFSGKVKTFATMVGLCLMIPFSALWLDIVVTAVIVLTTVYSGTEYFIQNKGVFQA